jgi:transposase
VTDVPAALDSDALQSENERLRRENHALESERRQLELKVRVLQQQLWGRKSERYVAEGEAQTELFADPAPVTKPAVAPALAAPSPKKPGAPKGPKPLDPALPREVIAVSAPAPAQLQCPVTGQLMQPGFVEALEVLARRPAAYFVKRYERTVFVSPAKTAPVYAPWPADVLPRSRVHASVVAHLAAAHYAEHLPFHRIEQQLARTGVDLPRNCQVSLMRQLDRLLAPLVAAMKADVLGSDYVMLDATPVPVCDPARPGAAREATLWAYRNEAGTVWFDYQASKSPQHPDAVLKGANFRGLLHTDGANGLGSIGPPGQVTSLGCFAHGRRYFFKACKAGERDAEGYLLGINRLFRIERLANHFRLTLASRETLRTRHSLPLFDSLVQRAKTQSGVILPKSLLGEAVHYLLAQQAPLRRCLEQARAELSTNAVERAIRPLKLGAKNWLHVGHPDAGPRLANLFTIVENCRLLAIDPEAYLIDLIARLPDHPARRIAELLPRAWRQPTPDATTGADASDADRSR